MNFKVVLVSVMVWALAGSAALAQATAPEEAAEMPLKTPAAASAPLDELSLRVQGSQEKPEAADSYKEALDIAGKAGAIGDEGQAFLLYTDVLLRLRKIQGKYPDFKTEEVDAKIKDVRAQLAALENAKCQSLENEKEGRFRFLVWQRQIMILDRIDKLQEAVNNNTQVLDDLKDKFGI